MELSLGVGDETVSVGENMNVTCKDCGAIQMFLEGQQKCSCCGKHMSNWSTHSQVKLKEKSTKGG